MENPNSSNAVETTESSASPTYHWLDPRRFIWGDANAPLQQQAAQNPEQKQEAETASWNLFGYFSAEQPVLPAAAPPTLDPDYVAFVFTPPEPHPGEQIANQTAAEEAAQIATHLSTSVPEPMPLAATPSDTSATVETDNEEATSTTAPEPKPDEKITGETDSNELEQPQRNLAIEAEQVRIAAAEQARSLQLQQEQEQAQAHQRNAMLLLQQQQAASERRLAAEQERQRVAAEQERQRVAAEQERQRVAAEKERKEAEARAAFASSCSTGEPTPEKHHEKLRSLIIAGGF